MNHKGSSPGPIDNLKLKNKILKNRERANFPETDDGIGITDRSDFYSLSVQFFKFFYDTFGCNQIMIVKI